MRLLAVHMILVIFSLTQVQGQEKKECYQCGDLPWNSYKGSCKEVEDEGKTTCDKDELCASYSVNPDKPARMKGCMDKKTLTGCGRWTGSFNAQQPFYAFHVCTCETDLCNCDGCLDIPKQKTTTVEPELTTKNINTPGKDVKDSGKATPPKNVNTSGTIDVHRWTCVQITVVSLIAFFARQFAASIGSQ